jgi:hypothetical protein
LGLCKAAGENIFSTLHLDFFCHHHTYASKGATNNGAENAAQGSVRAWWMGGPGGGGRRSKDDRKQNTFAPLLKQIGWISPPQRSTKSHLYNFFQFLFRRINYCFSVGLLKVPKREIFDRSDFPDLYTIKSLFVGNFGVKITNFSSNN